MNKLAKIVQYKQWLLVSLIMFSNYAPEKRIQEYEKWETVSLKKYSYIYMQ